MTKTILIADDSERIRALVRDVLERASYNVIDASCGEKAIVQLNGQHIDLIITDLNMPILNGIEVVEKARKIEQYKFIPILLLTTELKQSKKMEAKAAGATGWIVKPFVESKLLDVVEKVLR